MDSIMEIINEKIGVQHDQLLQRRSRSMPAASLMRSSSTGQNMAMVGSDDVLIEVMDKLTRGQLDRQIIPIVGMGGIGKTTLVRNVYKNRVVTQHFDVLAWVTVSQEYTLTDILEQLQGGRVSLSQMDVHELGNKLHKRLSGRRYLIILDDMWDIQVWDQVRRFFPDNKNGSRIVVTTRISDFQLTGSCVVEMGFLDEDQIWNLFSKIVFREEGCPVELKDIGKYIVRNCRGLPPSIVVVGGLLAKSEYTQEYWKYIANNLNSIVNSEDDESCLKILHMGYYDQLPVYLKPCFLYMGVFPEDEKINVSRLVKLWVAEGFLKPIKGKNSEEIAKEYLKELISRNLVLVNELGCTGNIKYCNIHDLLRDLCLREVQKQRFYNAMPRYDLDGLQNISTRRRVLIPNNTSEEKIHIALQFMSLARSLICDFKKVGPLLNPRLLRIMSYSQFGSRFLEDMSLLVNCRCFVLNAMYYKFPSSIHLFWSLHTLIVQNTEVIRAPFEIWKMPQLRNLQFKKGLYLPDPLNSKGTYRSSVTFDISSRILLPRLEKLVLQSGSCNGHNWETVEGHFPNLKYLRIDNCNDLEYWVVESSHFPRLEQLVLWKIQKLKEIPSEIEEILTLKLIELVACCESVVCSANNIAEEQKEIYGEVGIQVQVRSSQLTF